MEGPKAHITTRICRARRTALRRGVALATLAVPAVCDACVSSHSSTQPEDQGNYTASLVDGDQITQLTGNAIYGTTQNSSGIILNVLYLWSGEPGGDSYNVIWFQRQNLALLEPGDYPIADIEEGDLPQDDFVALYAFADSTAAATFYSVTGTLTISTAETLELTGTFEITGSFVEQAFHSGVVGDTVQVSGTFRAVPGTIQ
ncbi:MAG: hypothetical protein JSW71_04375 [Gemmatimonadota bacterium]|nr:MAG: hypothetical protein JSW71_04375 [Gemmatimonadota bacterium]